MDIWDISTGFLFCFFKYSLKYVLHFIVKKLFYIHVLSELPENFEGGQGSLASFSQLWKLRFRKVIGWEEL